MQWNPIAQPLPVAPNGVTDTVFTSLIKAYSIRTDVSSYFRTLWRPLLPTFVDVVNAARKGMPYPFQKTFALAVRILECVFRLDAMVTFPPTACAVCRSLVEMGGQEGLHTFLLYYLVMPNLVKLMVGDECDSLGNERALRLGNIDEIANKYFDINIWWPEQATQGKQQSKVRPSLSTTSYPSIHGRDRDGKFPNLRGGVGAQETGSEFGPVVELIWLVWRLYTGSALIDSVPVTTLTCADFFEGTALCYRLLVGPICYHVAEHYLLYLPFF